MTSVTTLSPTNSKAAANTAFEVENVITGPLVQLLCANSAEFASDIETVRTTISCFSNEYEIGGKKVTLDVESYKMPNNKGVESRRYDVSIRMSEKPYLRFTTKYEIGYMCEGAYFSADKSCDLNAIYEKAKALEGKPMGDLLPLDGIFAELTHATIQGIGCIPGKLGDGDMIYIGWVDNVNLDGIRSEKMCSSP